MMDILIIGAGICGSFLAHKLAHYDIKVTVLEKEHDIASGVSKANSAIVHAGYDPKEGTLKALLNVQGASMYKQICHDIGADYELCGAYVLAHKDTDFPHLDELAQRAQKRGIYYEMLSSEQLRKEEAHIADDIIAALSFPDTAIINPWQVAINLMEEAVLNGTTLHLNEEVLAIEAQANGYRVTTQKQVYDCHILINAAGCGAEKIAQLLQEQPFHLTFKKGQYYVLSKQVKGFVKHILYPLPDEHGKGVLALPTTHGNTLLGPTAEIVDQVDLGVDTQGLDKVQNQLNKIVKDVPYQEVIHSYSGVRPCGNEGDFYIKESVLHPNLIHVACIDSPGLASAPAIANYVYEQLLIPNCTFVEKKSFVKRRKHINLQALSIQEANKIIKQEPKYGHIICRCEQVSEAEIIDVIHRPCGARSIKDIKKRVRPGMGKCQGGFCEVEVAKILARELSIPLHEVLYDQITTPLGEVGKTYENN